MVDTRYMAARRFSSFWNYFVATFVTVTLTWGWYRYLRLGGEETPLSALNSGLAMATLALLAIILLLGPLGRMYNLFDRWLKYRKELGILAFITGAIHVYLVMFPLARRGPFGFYLSRPLSAYPGLAGLVIMLILFIFSFDHIKKLLPAATWWKMQYWGVRVTFLVIVFHMIILKYTGWMEWFKTVGTLEATLPPAALLGTIIAVFVLFVRLGEMVHKKLTALLTPLVFLMLSGLLAFVFIFNRPITPTLMIYKGTLPCADCPGIDATLTLFPTGAYSQVYIYRERTGTFEEKGTWVQKRGLPQNATALYDELSASPSGNKTYYRVTAESLVPLDGDRNEIPSPYNAPLILQK